MLNRFFLVIVFNLLLIAKGYTQNFNYSLTKDSSAYTSLSGATVLTIGEDFKNKNFNIHLPFQFNFCGSLTDSITIESNGFVVFDNNKGLSLIAFNNFTSNKDTIQAYQSSIVYSVSGTQGNRIVLIEYKNLSQNTFSFNDNLSYQIWLYEYGNKIEFHIGDNSYSNYTESSLPVMLGVINKNMDTESNAYLITGNPTEPTGQLINAETEFVYLNNIPSEGIVLKLTPSFN